ncbi:uncharacterized protein DUF4352 [Pseudonocardia hierapolitana]|uniref:Uncharacterized protein DUF4352 n=1 Tax=Pseudonocardia hierapolitana TaxID=1128676 RepID=A0A561SL97_9PSEU|nr:DUF4352 domain-containing protein [Pseudonocardia hierapolitana]TWF75645.1 uncharacterized protein DUF4352 [Pseudonocardia hierapolitana]
MTHYGPYLPRPAGHSTPPPAPQNGLGTAGFVLGLVGLLFSFIPLIGIIAWPLVLLGVILSGIGLSRARNGRATNMGLTIAGVTCSAIGLLVCIGYAAAFGAAVSTVPAASTSPTGLAAPTPNIAAEQSSADAPQAGIGDQVQDGAFAFTVTKVETGREALGDGFLRSEAQGSYVLVHVTVTNVGAESAMFTSVNQTLLDAQGREFEADAGAAMMNVPDSESFLTDINPGNTVDGVLVFDVPQGLTPAAIELRESMFSDGATVALAG